MTVTTPAVGARHQQEPDDCLKNCGEQATWEMGFELVTEQHPWRLERQTMRAINSFKERDPEAKVEFDHPMKEEGSMRNGYIVSVLEPPHAVLVNVLGTWISQHRGTEKAFIRKEAALKAYEQKFSIYAKSAEMLYRWAGLEEEARRIKPSVRRPGQRAVVADDEPRPADTGAANTDVSPSAAEGDNSVAPGPVNP